MDNIDLNRKVDGQQLTTNENIAKLEAPVAVKQKRSPTTDQKLSDRASEYALIQYLSTLVKKRNVIESFDFDFVEYLLENGANINNCDVIGQSPFHIVAKYWNIDVARFLLDNGAEINAQDCFGRSPLHEACALNYVDMVEFLLQNGANIDIQTFNQKQRPIHFGAKNDSCQCLTKLLAYGADINSLDSKNRTPLQLAAEMNRADIALLLINEGASVSIYDNEGNSALTLLTEKMPDIAVQAMDQLYSTDNVNRKEFFSLNNLEGAKINEGRATAARTPLEIAVQKRCFSIVMHPVVQRLIELKWEHYGKAGAIWDLMLNLGYALLWTILSLALCHEAKRMYLPLDSKGWLLCIVIVIVIMTGTEIRKHIKDTLRVRQQEKDWINWRTHSLEEDLGYCHPGSTGEWKYLAQEVKSVRNHSTYFKNCDGWIYFDWLALLLVITAIITHIAFLRTDSNTAYKIHRCILIKLLLVLWIRIAKYARPFQSTGPIVVIFSHILKDIVKCSFLFAILFIPYACAFWVTFGPFSPEAVPGYNNFGDLFHTMLCMVVGVDFPFEDLLSVDPFMARVLCSSFIISTAVIVVNLLIALLSDTFTRLYSNAVANAVMQRAQSILQMEKTMCKKRKQDYYKFMRNNCSPQVVSMDFRNQPKTEKGGNTTDKLLNEIKTLKITVESLQAKCNSAQERTSASIGELLKHNHENTVKMIKILNILAGKKQTDPSISNYPFKRQDISEQVERLRKDPAPRKVLESSGSSISTAQNIGRRRRCSSLGEINEAFEDSEFPDTLTPRTNDMIVNMIRHRRSTLRRSNSVSAIPAFNFLASGGASSGRPERYGSFARRFILFNSTDSHRPSNGSISL